MEWITITAIDGSVGAVPVSIVESVVLKPGASYVLWAVARDKTLITDAEATRLIDLLTSNGVSRVFGSAPDLPEETSKR